jgi:hypothetical protein
MKIFVAPHDIDSCGAKSLAMALKAKRILPEHSRYKYFPNHVVINWGRRNIPWYRGGMNVINRPENVATAINKVSSFNVLLAEKVRVPNFSTNIEDAKNWIKKEEIVFCRTLTSASAGRGIVIARQLSELVPAPLYVAYKKKKSEFRIAVVDGKVVDFSQKRRKTDFEGEVCNLIRSHDKGWVFCRENCVPPKIALDEAVKAVKAMKLDFGAVDVIYNESENHAYVLEVNTAPGLEGQTIINYSNALGKLIQDKFS